MRADEFLNLDEDAQVFILLGMDPSEMNKLRLCICRQISALKQMEEGVKDPLSDFFLLESIADRARLHRQFDQYERAESRFINMAHLSMRANHPRERKDAN